MVAANGNAPFWSPYESNSILDLLRMEPGARSALAFPRYECGASLTMLTRQKVEARLRIAAPAAMQVPRRVQRHALACRALHSATSVLQTAGFTCSLARRRVAPAAAFASAYCVLQTRALRHKLNRESGPSAWLRSTVARLSAACSAIELQKG